MSFSIETEKENKLSFHAVEIIRNQGKFTTTIYRKPTFSGICSNFEGSLPSVYKFCMVYPLVYRCFRISHRLFYNNIHLVKVKVPTVEKKAFTPSPSILRNNIFTN